MNIFNCKTEMLNCEQKDSEYFVFKFLSQIFVLSYIYVQ